MRRQVQFKPRFFILIGLLVAAVVTGVLVLNGGGGRKALQSGKQTLKLPVSAVIIRDERSISAEKYDRVTYALTEGSPVTADTLVATVYKWGYSDEMTQSLCSIRTEIYKAQKKLLEGIEYPELTVMELSIKQKEEAIRTCAMNGTGCLLTLETELKTLLAERSTYLRSAVQPNEELTALYASETDKLAQIAAYQTDVYATGDGVVSFYFDGYEEALNAGKLSTLNAELINNVVKGSASASETGSETQLYRLINDAHWYIAFVTPLSDPLRVAEGMQYVVAFEGYEDNLYAGTALTPVISDVGVLNILECNSALGPLSSARAVKATVSMEAEGFAVEAQAVTVKDGVAGITVQQESGSARVKVNELSSDGETAIIRPRDGAVLSEGMKYEG